MVWNTCRRSLRDLQDAEDVFQATFLVLAKKSGTLRWRDSVAGWLYAVALRLAAKARCQAARRPQSVATEPAAPDPFDALSARDLLAALDEEMAALPERYRGPAVLCWLEGRTQQEAAKSLGMPFMTLRRRLERGRQLLHARLTRRGLTLTVALAAPALADAVPVTTLAGALPGHAATPRATALAETLLSSAAGKVRIALVLVLVCTVAAGVGLTAFSPPGAPTRMAGQDAPALSQPAGKPMQQVDALGDPLPLGAVVRLGSMRLRGESSTSVAFSPDGKWLAAGGWGKQVRLWDPATGKEGRILTGWDRGMGWDVAIAPDGKLLAASGSDKAITLWDLETGKEVGRLTNKLPGDSRTLAFSPKSDLLITADREFIRIWDVIQKKLQRSIEAKGANPVAVSFGADGRALVAVSDEKGARIWGTGGKLLHDLKGHKGPIAGSAFSADGKLLLTVGSQETRVWDVTNGKKLDALPGAQGSLAVFSRDGKLLAVAGTDHCVHLWDWVTRKELPRTPRHADHIRSLAFSPDGRTLASVGDASPIHLWDTATGARKHALAGHQERLLSTAYAPDGHSVVTCSWDGTARVWDARAGKELRRLEIFADKVKDDPWRSPGSLGKVVLSPDGKLVAVTRGDEVVVLCDFQSGKQVRSFMGGCLAFSPDGKWIAVGTRGTSGKSFNVGEIHLYDRGSGELRSKLQGHLTPVVGLAFTPNSQTLVSRGVVFFGARSGEPGESETKHVRVWDLATGKLRRSLAEGTHPSHLALSPDGRTTASTGLIEKTILLVEAATGGPRGELTGNKETVFDIAYSPDGRTVASAGMDGTVRLWDAFTLQEIGRLEGHRGWVLTVAFSPDGGRLVSGGLDTTALVWDVSRLTHRPIKVAEITGAEFDDCWEDLGGSARQAYRAMAKLLSVPQRSIAFLGGRVKPAPAGEARRVAQLIADLGSDQFKVRDQADQELQKLGEVAAPALQKAFNADPPLEIKRRLEILLGKLTNWPPDTLRQVRAVELLEHVGTVEARGVLERLVREGAPEGRLTREAETALRRLKE
jgi:RNA polymerase sigma factor (sigma-70 family)